MIRHAMTYAQMAQKVAAESDDLETVLRMDEVYQRLVAAEQQLVREYGNWRDAMKVAAERGSDRAARYLERTTWDLT